MLYTKNWKKSMWNWRMLIACAGAFVLLCQPVFSFSYGFFFNKNNDILSATISPVASMGFLPVACIFPTIPYAFDFLEKYNSGYIFLVRQRMPIRKIKLNQIFFTMISGAMAAGIPFIALYTIAAFMCAPTTPEMFPGAFLGTEWEPYMFIWGGKLVCLLSTLNTMTAGMVWALVALLCSMIFMNRYVAVVMPLVIYQAGWLCFHGDILGYLNPAGLYRGGVQGIIPGFTFWVQLAFIIVLLVAVERLMQRRLGRE